MSLPLTQHDDLLDLLVKEASEGLSVVEQQQLQQWLGRPAASEAGYTADEFASAAAALSLLAALDSASAAPAMPAALQARILASVPSSVADPATHRAVDKVVPLPTMSHAAAATSVRWQHTGWWVAAACFALAVWGWWPRLLTQPDLAPPVVTLTAAEQRAQLLSSGRAIQASWQPGNDPAATALQGDVVFDPVSQRGYLRFRGIPANDPRLAQYQLWIADGARSQPQPVDGGVFDVSSNPSLPQTTPEGDVIIPFEARLQVGKPAAFVVTVEQPGGVVVSSQERVLALAAVTP